MDDVHRMLKMFFFLTKFDYKFNLPTLLFVYLIIKRISVPDVACRTHLVTDNSTRVHTIA